MFEITRIVASPRRTVLASLRVWAVVALFLLGVAAFGEDNLLLEMTFDKGTLASEVGSGALPTLAPDRNAAPVFGEGVSGKALILTGQSLEVPLKGNVDCRQGTLSFWIKPMDWGNETPGMTRIWHVGDAIWAGRGMELYFYKGGDAGVFSFRVEQRKDFRGFSDDYVTPRSGLPRKGEWLHLALTWNGIEQALYVNGKRTAFRDYGLPVELRPVPDAYRMVFMVHSVPPAKDYRRTTALDDVRVYAAPLRDSDILQIAQAYAGDPAMEGGASVLAIPKSARPVVVDGTLDAEEWGDASRAPVMKMMRSSSLSPVPAWVHAKYSGGTLYLGYEVFYQGRLDTPAVGRYTNATGGRHICLGDEVEFHCRRAGQGAEKFDQFIVAPNGAWAYLKSEAYNRVRDDAPTGFRSAARVLPDRWTVEMAVPLSEIGFDPAKGGELSANAGIHRPNDDRIPGDAMNRWHCWSGGGGRLFVDPACMGKFLFAKDSTSVRIEGFGSVHYGGLDVDLSCLGAKGEIALIRMQDVGKEHPLARELPFENGHAEAREAIPWRGNGDLSVQVLSADTRQALLSFGTRVFVGDAVAFDFRTLPSENRIRVTADLMGLKQKYAREIAEGKASLHLTLADATGRLCSEATITPKTYDLDVSLPMPDLPVGTYTVGFALRVGTETFTLSKEFERPDPIFLTDRKGLERGVPAPWNPVRREGDTVKVLNREYRFGQGPFPVAAVSNSVSVLSSEPEFRVTAKGKVCRFEPGRSAEVEAASDRLVTSGVSEATKAGLRMEWTRRIDYDGLIRCDVRLLPINASAAFDRLDLTVRVPEDAAVGAITHRFAPEWLDRSTQGITAFPQVWLTSDAAGLSFFTDSDANWVYPKGTMPIRVFREGKTAVIQAGIIAAPVTLRAPARYVFGLMATPSKEPRKGIYNDVMEGGPDTYAPKNRNLRILNSSSEQFFGKSGWLLSEVTYPEELRAVLDGWAKAGCSCVPYACGYCMPTNNPIFNFYGEDWIIRQQGRKLALHTTTTRNGHEYQFADVCASSGFAEYMTYYVDRYLRDTIMAGLYLDFASSVQSDSIDDGHPRKDVLNPDRLPLSYNVFPVRSLYERLYKIIHSHRPDGYLFLHQWDMFHPAVISFADIVTPGEEFEFTAPAHPETYIDDVPLVQWQTDYYGPALGANVQFLGETYSYPGAEKLTVQEKHQRSIPAITACLLHDATLYGFAVVGNVRDILIKNRTAEGEFHPYWRQKEIATGDDKVLASYYAWRGEKRRLVALGNWDKADKNVRLLLNDAAMKNVTATDEESGAPVPIAQPLLVKGRNYRILHLRWE